MKQISLSGAGIKVSSICLGAMYFGSKTGVDVSENLLDGYINAGGNFIDTANIYASWIPGFRGGESEELLGNWMEKRKNRDNLVIATKVGIDYPGVERGLSAEQIKTECEKSLRRLKTDVIDVYYAHADDHHTPLYETLSAFDDLLIEGKIRSVGASNYSAERLKEADRISEESHLTEFCCLQQRYSYLKATDDFKLSTQLVLDQETTEYCNMRNKTILAFSPLLGGTYKPGEISFPGFYNTNENIQRINILNKISEETGYTLNQLVLAWMLNSYPPVMPVIGVSKIDQLGENIKSADIKLNDEIMGRLGDV